MEKIRERLEGKKIKKIKKFGAEGYQRNIQQDCCIDGQIKNIRKGRKKDRKKTRNNRRELVSQNKES